jgi:hypothetical protein
MSADEPFVERTIGDWTCYQDDEGRVYYYNSVTEESAWDPPPGFEDDAPAVDETAAGGEVEQIQTPPPEDNDGVAATPSVGAAPDNDGITASPSVAFGDDDDDGFTQSPTVDEQPQGEDDAADGEDIGGGWVAYKDDEGRTYYYNSESGETQWDKPDVDSKTDATKADQDDYMDASPTASDREDELEDINQESTTTTDDKKDPATIAENFLKGPDAVMESQVLDHISTLVTQIGPQEAGRKAMHSLMNGYQGDTAICGMMALWLAELKASNAAIDKNTKRVDRQRFNQGADAARDVVEQVVNRLAKERFTKDGGDAIMKLSKKQVAFVDAMIESERWRNLLVSASEQLIV